MSSIEDRCPHCGQLDVNCGCIPPRNVSGHEEAKKMEQETAKAMQEAERKAP